MKDDLQTVLIQIQIILVDLTADPHLLHPPLKAENFLTQDETDLITREITTTEQLLMIFKILKGKDDHVLTTLQKIFHHNRWWEPLNAMRKTLEELGYDNLLLESCSYKGLVENNSKHDRIIASLKFHYIEALEHIEKYWNKFGVLGQLRMEIFYNQNIEISDRYEKLQTPIAEFNNLFTIDYKRIVIFAAAGYGKSTFVHEMARQWVIGKQMWTQKFSFLFLFCLKEVHESETGCFANLLSRLLGTESTDFIIEQLKDLSFIQKCLFVFDGLDEVQYEFCKEISDLIYGERNQWFNVIVTTRPGVHFEQLRNSSCRNLYIELNGFTPVGIKQQLDKFSIPIIDNLDIMENVLKVPLFNTLFCITNDKSSIGCLSLCAAVEKFIQYICNRFRASNKIFLQSEEENIIMYLGKLSQNKYAFMKKFRKEAEKKFSFTKKLVEVMSIVETKKQKDNHSNVNETDVLKLAINIGLVLPNSTMDDLIFAHHTIAEYCAAYFWFKTSPLKAESISLSRVNFCEPKNMYCFIDTTFSSFLSGFNNTYKTFLWKNFDAEVPVLDEYKMLPKRLPVIKEEFDWLLRFDMLFKVACDQYRKSNEHFTKSEENELISCLGQAAQCKYLCMKGSQVQYPKINSKMLSIAINAGLIQPQSTETEIIFHNELIATYCAAYFWSKKYVLSIDKISGDHVYFKDPRNIYCLYCDSFSRFLTNFDAEYKQFAKKYLELELTTIKNACTMYFSSHSRTEQNDVLTAVDFFSIQEELNRINLVKATFESGYRFQSLQNFRGELFLNNCSIKLPADEFFYYYGMRYLYLLECTFNFAKSKLFEISTGRDPTFIVQNLIIEYSDYSFLPFLSYVMAKCPSLKLLYLPIWKTGQPVPNAMYTEDWIVGLNNNTLLQLSLNELYLDFSSPPDLSNFFDALLKLTNLTYFDFRIRRSFSETEDGALSKAFEFGCRNLKKLTVYFPQSVNMFCLQNVCNLLLLKSFRIRNEHITLNELCALLNNLKTLELDEFEFNYRNVYYSEDCFVVLKECINIQKLEFHVDDINEESFELFTKKLKSLNFYYGATKFRRRIFHRNV